MNACNGYGKAGQNAWCVPRGVRGDEGDAWGRAKAARSRCSKQKLGRKRRFVCRFRPGYLGCYSDVPRLCRVFLERHMGCFLPYSHMARPGNDFLFPRISQMFEKIKGQRKIKSLSLCKYIEEPHFVEIFVGTTWVKRYILIDLGFR